MTDNEIIKALECCVKAPYCGKKTDCPYKGIDDCVKKHTLDALDLINRQKAEIDALRKTILDADYSSITALKAKESWHMENSEYIDRLKEEIEKLRKRANFVEQANVQLREEFKETTEKFNCQQYVYADLSDIIRDKNAEIERLTEMLNATIAGQETLQKALAELNPLVMSSDNASIVRIDADKIKAEAIKEVIEKTQEFLSTKCRGVVEDNPNLDEILYGYRIEDVDEFFDNLVKETVGDE